MRSGRSMRLRTRPYIVKPGSQVHVFAPSISPGCKVAASQHATMRGAIALFRTQGDRLPDLRRDLRPCSNWRDSTRSSLSADQLNAMANQDPGYARAWTYCKQTGTAVAVPPIIRSSRRVAVSFLPSAIANGSCARLMNQNGLKDRPFRRRRIRLACFHAARDASLVSSWPAKAGHPALPFLHFVSRYPPRRTRIARSSLAMTDCERLSHRRSSRPPYRSMPLLDESARAAGEARKLISSWPSSCSFRGAWAILRKTPYLLQRVRQGTDDVDAFTA